MKKVFDTFFCNLISYIFRKDKWKSVFRMLKLKLNIAIPNKENLILVIGTTEKIEKCFKLIFSGLSFHTRKHTYTLNTIMPQHLLDES